MAVKQSASNALNMRLGQLELQVMELVWIQGETDARRVRDSLETRRREKSLSTVQSTLERLVRKGLLERNRHGQAYHYRASRTRSELMASMISDVIHLLHDGRMDTILSSFVDMATTLDADSLARLEKLIEEKKRSGNKSIGKSAPHTGKVER